ncbi:SagB/ThcOx family dehydrogenase [Aquirufa ecclesiirivi]|uniref:SagB/ThcOx family dehydrogenase n=1 Tax=Aquirufa ecclesiirivi TaxID=2715124 RepID=A0ABT4JHN2_9BACT|nr:SagB family peptide dehydrogenase [Aquirufa ecclesiirivi]MCZ2475448.1 SagB/ThcOx family dehydrogenase [Aquirufa ecclesiirivi]NHC48758.1 SagB/ThcOx family dehydrogenase [Aquirufa ecclesiirivi]
MAKTRNLLFEPCISDISFDFLEQSKLYSYQAKEYSERLHAVMSSDYFMKNISHHSIELGFCDEYDLLTIDQLPPLAEALNQLNQERNSQRNYDSEELVSFQDLSRFLQLSYSITQRFDPTLFIPPRRNIASGGGLYPIDVYVINQHISDLPLGVFIYDLFTNKLKLIHAFKNREELKVALNRTLFAEQKNDIDYINASAFMVLGAELERSCFKYLDRGIRWAMLEAGEIVHAMYLASAGLELSTCAIGGFNDEALARLINFQNPSQITLLALALGK